MGIRPPNDNAMKLPGKITITRPSGQGEGEYISIKIEDNGSTVEFVELRMSLESFALAVTASGFQPVEMTVRGLNYIGTQREHKRVPVPYTDRIDKNDKAGIASALAPFEVDGWKGRGYDLVNPNNRNYQEKTAHVVFERYINTATGEPVIP